MTTPSVAKAQEQYFGQSLQVPSAENDPLGPEENEFIETRNSFYLGTVSETGWPYIQHRGGKQGFLKVVNPKMLAFADYKGNRQMLSTGNISVNDRVALFLMDYSQRTRLKIMGHARVEDARLHPELVHAFADPEVQRLVERIFLIDVVSFDWNCPQYITPRYTLAEIEEVLTPYRNRIAELEEELRRVNGGG